MKKILVLLLSLLTFGLNAQGTKLKIKQLENPGTSSLNLGANSFSAGAQSTISTLYVPNTATVNGAFLANSTSTFVGALKANSTGSVASSFTAGNVVINGGSSSLASILMGTQAAVSSPVNGQVWLESQTTNGWIHYLNDATNSGYHSQWKNATHSYAIYLANTGSTPVQFGSTTNGAIGMYVNGGSPKIRIATTGNVGINTTQDVASTFSVAGDAGISSSLTCGGNIVSTGTRGWLLGEIAGTPRIGYFTNEFQLSTAGNTDANLRFGTGKATTSLRVGSSVAPSATLDVTGTMSVSSTGRTGTISTSASYSPALSVLATGNAITGSGMGLYTENSTGGRNFAFLLNDNQYGDFVIRQGTALGSDPFAGNRRFVISPEGNIGINNASPAATLQVSGTMSVSSTSTLNGLNLASGGYSVTTKVIDATAGDAVTINSPVGQFRKDVTGTTFVLTNSQITANSVIMLTAANAAIDATATGWTISKGAGSATITFNAAPTANFDMMFMIMN